MQWPPVLDEIIMQFGAYVDWYVGVWHCQKYIFILKHVDFLVN